MKTFPAVALLMFAACTPIFAIPAPEIDPASAGTAFVLLTTATLIIRSRRKP
jgi:hypothetical protein